MPAPHVLLVTYDLNPEGHEHLRREFTSRWGEEGGPTWIRVQRSVLMVRTEHSAVEFRERFFDWPSDLGEMLVIDITQAPYAGQGSKRAWDWLTAALEGARVDRMAIGANRLRDLMNAEFDTTDKKTLALSKGWPDVEVSGIDASWLRSKARDKQQGTLTFYQRDVLNHRLPGWGSHPVVLEDMLRD